MGAVNRSMPLVPFIFLHSFFSPVHVFSTALLLQPARVAGFDPMSWGFFER